MTSDFRSICGIGPVVGIGIVVGPTLVVSLTNKGARGFMHGLEKMLWTRKRLHF